MQVLGTAIIIARLVIIPCIALAVSNLMSWGKRRERQHFSDTVNESILRKHMSARNIKRFLNVVDKDHKNGDRSNSNNSDCQAHVLIIKLENQRVQGDESI